MFELSHARRATVHSTASVLTRILVLEDDALPGSAAPPVLPDQPYPAKDEQESAEAAATAVAATIAGPLPSPPGAAAALRPASSAATRVLTPIITQQLRVLIARISELLGFVVPSRVPSADVLWCGEWMVDMRARVVTRGGQRLNLSRRESDLFFALVRRRGAVATRMELVHEIWGPATGVRPRVVDTMIARLRRKLEDVPSEPRYILTAVAHGYRFAAASIGESP